MKNILKVSVLFLLLIGTSSCFMDGVKGDGNVVMKNRKISNDFSKVVVSRGIDLYITKSKGLELEIEADENLHELITTEVNNGVLEISSSRNIWSASSKKVHLHVDYLNALVVNSGAEAHTENTFSSDEFDINVSSGANADLDLKVKDLTCDSSSGADVVLSGSAENFRASSSSGSDIKAFDLEAQNCVASASSGADIKLWVTESFDGIASSGADISFRGNPKKMNSSDNSGGSIRNTGS